MKTLMRFSLIFVLICSTLFAIIMAVVLANNQDIRNILLFLSGLLAATLSYLGESYLCRKISEDDANIRELKEYTLPYPALKTAICFLAFSAISIALSQYLFQKTIYWPEDWKGLIGLAFCIPLALTSGMALALRTGKPAFKIDSKGAFVSGYGFIPWAAIQGIQAHYDERSGLFVRLKINEIARFKQQMDPLARLLLPLRSKTLKNVIQTKVGSRESQHTIIDLARNLWQQSTSKKDVWVMGMSDEALTALQRQEQLLAELEKTADSGDPDQIKKTMEKIDSDFSILESEMKRSVNNHRRSIWILISSLIVFLCLVHMD